MLRSWTILLLVAPHTAAAYEYRLEFTPPAGARNLVVAGYQFLNANTVVGNCSYDTVSVGSGRIPHSTITHHPNTCTWDRHGNLVSSTAGTAPTAPLPIRDSGTEVIYATWGTSTTGVDTRGFGFVNSLSPHYDWDASDGTYAVIPDAAIPIVGKLTSDGDQPLHITVAHVTSSISGTLTTSAGTAIVASTTCPNPVPVGMLCSFTVAYNPKTIKCTASPYGYAYTKVDLSLVTNSGATIDYTRSFTITGVPVCND
jgi:hypothetical protein